MDVWVRRDRGVLAALAGSVDELHRVTHTPVTSRRIWLQTWLDCYPAQQLVAIGAESDGQLVGLAVLAERRGRLGRRLVACGDGPSDAVMLPTRSEAAAGRVADALVEELLHIPGPWRLTLRQVLAGDRVLPAMAERLPHTLVVPGDVSPVLHTTGNATLRPYVTSSHHRGISRIRNRMVREGLSPQVVHTQDVAEVERMLPEIERVFRARDRMIGRRCPLDVPQDREFFRAVVRRHALLSQVCLTTLHLSGRLAAYVLCFLDEDVHRMWNCRFDPVWGQFSPGKLAVDESVAHALEAGSRSYDFMRGVEGYKDSYATARPMAQELWSASGPVSGAAVSALMRTRARVRRIDASGGLGARLVDRTRRARDRWGWL